MVDNNNPFHDKKRKNLYMFNLPTDYEGRLNLVLEMAKKKDVTILELPEGLPTKGHIIYRCNIHGRVCDTVVKRFLVFENKPKCCGNAAKVVDYGPRVAEKAEQLNHKILKTEGSGAKGKVWFYCPEHDFKSAAMVNEQYMRNPHGLMCCSRKVK